MSDRPEFGSGGGGGAGGGNIIIVKRIKKGGHGHHGGAWKVAYADFVTAMMAFFLLLWLLNSVSEDTLSGISNYFTPIAASSNSSGAGGMLGGLTIGEGSQQSQSGSVAVVPLPPPTVGAGGQDLTDPGEGPSRDPTEEDIDEALRERQEAQFEQAADELEQLIQGIPELAELSESLLIDYTPEGLRIQIVDQDGLPLFPSGSAAMYGYTRQIISLVARVVAKLPNELSITGHTDATPFSDPSGYSNWELSADRALATRRVLEDFGVVEQRVAKVTGQAANEPLLEDDPTAPQNRRISIVLLRDDGSAAEAFDRLPDFLQPRAPN
ncbi:MAG: flagellar motor protein MotB [Rhodospirillaceae bacterium]